MIFIVDFVSLTERHYGYRRAKVFFYELDAKVILRSSFELHRSKFSKFQSTKVTFIMQRLSHFSVTFEAIHIEAELGPGLVYRPMKCIRALVWF